MKMRVEDEDIFDIIRKLHEQHKVMRLWADTVERRLSAIEDFFTELSKESKK